MTVSKLLKYIIIELIKPCVLMSMQALHTTVSSSTGHTGVGGEKLVTQVKEQWCH